MGVQDLIKHLTITNPHHAITTCNADRLLMATRFGVDGHKIIHERIYHHLKRTGEVDWDKLCTSIVQWAVAIISDLFPGVTVPFNDTGELMKTILEQIDAAGLQPHPVFINKTLQLYETFNVRFGAVLVGPTMAGKSAGYRLLASAMAALRVAGSKNETFQKVTYTILNPKCITMGELYGEFNEMTQEWTDGLASTIIRGFVADETEDRKWTVLDGPIDALWIENMNTVLDDNMTFCHELPQA